jgi:hypothetical protein
MNPLADITCASFHAAYLPMLGGLRTRSGLRGWPEGTRIWLRWDFGDEDLIQRLLPIPGVELFRHHQGHWYRLGHQVPDFNVPPETRSLPLAQLLTPAPCQPMPVTSSSMNAQVVHLVREEQPRATTALVCTLGELFRWAKLATSWQLKQLRGTWNADRVLVLGSHLPVIPGAQRYWGQGLLIPLGWRPEPLLPETILVLALGLRPDHVGLLRPQGIERIPLTGLGPITRGGLRRVLDDHFVSSAPVASPVWKPDA